MIRFLKHLNMPSRIEFILRKKKKQSHIRSLKQTLLQQKSRIWHNARSHCLFQKKFDVRILTPFLHLISFLILSHRTECDKIPQSKLKICSKYKISVTARSELKTIQFIYFLRIRSVMRKKINEFSKKYYEKRNFFSCNKKRRLKQEISNT